MVEWQENYYDTNCKKIEMKNNTYKTKHSIDTILNI